MQAPPSRPDAEDTSTRSGYVVVGVNSPDDARILVPIASRAAAARELRVLLAHAVPEDAEPHVHGREDGPRVDEIDRLAREHVSAGVPVEVIHRWGRPDTALQGLVREYGAELLVISSPSDPDPTEGTSEERALLRSSAERARRLFLDPPCEAWLVVGGLAGRAARSVLVAPSEREPSDRALRAARALVDGRNPIHVLDVQERDDAEPSPGLLERLDERLGAGGYRVRTVGAKSRERAMMEAIDDEAYDLLVMDVPMEGVVPGLLSPHLPDALSGRLDGQPLVVVNAPQRRAVVRMRRLLDRMYSWLGILDPETRGEVYRDLRRGSRADRQFLTLTILATAIAALGLILDSAAVIIGAMLVAPFMAPTIALGLAVVYGDTRFMRVAVAAMFKGSLVGFGVALIAGALVPPSGLSEELLARTEVSGLDIMVALLSGAAGAYAFGRRELSATLPGVAIAAALVPPLAASAITIGAGEIEQGLRALLLYVINLLAIAGASAVIFLWFGFRPEIQRFGRVRSFVSGLVMIGALLSLVGAAVVFLGNQDREAARRELAAEGIIEEWLPSGTELTDFSVHTAEGVVQVEVDLISLRGLEEGAARTLAALIAAELDQPVRVALQVIPAFEGTAERPEGE